MPSIHRVALDSDLQLLRSSNTVNLVKIHIVGSCVDAANTLMSINRVCELVSHCHYEPFMNSLLQIL